MCVGGSYIATEVAATLTSMGHKCALVMQEDVTLERTFGKTAGGVLPEDAHRQRRGDPRRPGRRPLRGRRPRRGGRHARPACAWTAHTVVVGVGAHPDVSLAKKAGLEIGERGGVVVDSTLATSAPDVFAAGDIAEYDSVVHGARLRIEHWDVAENQGKTAARSMLGSDEPFDVVPYFFSDLADWTWMEYVGPAYEWDEEIVRGSLEDSEFCLWYLKDGRVAGASGGQPLRRPRARAQADHVWRAGGSGTAPSAPRRRR